MGSKKPLQSPMGRIWSRTGTRSDSKTCCTIKTSSYNSSRCAPGDTRRKGTAERGNLTISAHPSSNSEVDIFMNQTSNYCVACSIHNNMGQELMINTKKWIDSFSPSNLLWKSAFLVLDTTRPTTSSEDVFGSLCRREEAKSSCCAPWVSHIDHKARTRTRASKGMEYRVPGLGASRRSRPRTAASVAAEKAKDHQAQSTEAGKTEHGNTQHWSGSSDCGRTEYSASSVGASNMEQ